jgi:hypothetical protein
MSKSRNAGKQTHLPPAPVEDAFWHSFDGVTYDVGWVFVEAVLDTLPDDPAQASKEDMNTRCRKASVAKPWRFMLWCGVPLWRKPGARSRRARCDSTSTP